MLSAELQLLFSDLASRLPLFTAEALTLLTTMYSGYSTNNLPTLQAAIHQLLRQRAVFPVQPAPDLPLLFFELPGTSPTTLLLYYHYDAASNDSASLLPFLASLAMLDLYQALNKPLPMTVKWLLDGNGDQKYPSLSMPSLAQQLQADYILWPQFSPEIASFPSLALGTRGYLGVSLSQKSPSQPFPSSYGSILPNPAWRLLWALHNLKDAREDILIEGFYDTLLPADDQAIAQLYALPSTLPLLPEEHPPFLLNLHDFQLHYTHLLTPTCSLLSFDTLPPTLAPSPTSHETPPALLPTQAQAAIDFYLVPAQEPEDIFMKLQQHLLNSGFSDLVFQHWAASYPTLISAEHPFVACLQKATSLAYGVAPTLLPLCADTFPFASTSLTSPLLVHYLPFKGPASNEESLLDPQHYARAIQQLTLILEMQATASP